MGLSSELLSHTLQTWRAMEAYNSYITKHQKGLQQYNSCCSKPLGVARYVQAMEKVSTLWRVQKTNTNMQRQSKSTAGEETPSPR